MGYAAPIVVAGPVGYGGPAIGHGFKGGFGGGHGAGFGGGHGGFSGGYGGFSGGYGGGHGFKGGHGGGFHQITIEHGSGPYPYFNQHKY